MATAPSGKWIDGVASNDKTSRVARKSLAERLRAVRRSLSRSARSSLIASESVHQLRVAARRAVEGLKLYADFVPRRRAAWITKQMKKLRKAAGPARDCDVLIHMNHYFSGTEPTEVYRLVCGNHIDTAKVASRAGVKTLVLTHMLEQIDQPGVRERIIKEIREIYDGNVIWGEDLMEIPVKGPHMFRME